MTVKKTIEDWYLPRRHIILAVLSIGWIISGVNLIIQRTWTALFYAAVIFIVMFAVGYTMFMETNAFLIQDIIHGDAATQNRALKAALPMGMGKFVPKVKEDEKK